MTTIKLRDYDLDAARLRFRARVDRERGLVFNGRGGLAEIDTESIRALDNWSTELRTALFSLYGSISGALERLPVEMGGAVSPVDGGYAALPQNLAPELPLVRALMVLRGHPCHPGFAEVPFERPEQPVAYPPSNIAPLLEAMYADDPQPWDLRRLERLVLDGAIQYHCGDVEIDPTWTPNMIYPGSQVGEYMWILKKTFLFDAFDAFEPSFTRRDALIGEWWLLQPVSPRLSHHHLAAKFGLHHARFLPPSHVDAEGRVVMACFPTQAMDDSHRVRLIEDSKFVAGWQKVLWAKDRAPLNDPGFDLVNLEGVTENSYGPYRHSSELPPWPPTVRADETRQ
jgi:hypothetical protein